MPATDSRKDADNLGELAADLVQVAQLALAGGRPDASPSVRRLARRYRQSRPELASALVGILRDSPVRALGTKLAPAAQPVDTESRLPLVREENPVVLPTEPILLPSTHAALDQLAQEHLDPTRLLQAGLAPTRTALFVGPPGVGKTLAARWLARALGKPLVVLDLASVMSSFLGKTGVNVRRVLDYAKETPCVLLLDELDAVAKRRDDATEIGELKRLVTVLLQEIDEWPEGSLLLAATNHPDLLDPAVWRRFEVVLDFPLPDDGRLAEALRQYLDSDTDEIDELSQLLVGAYDGASFSELEREVMLARRMAAVQDIAVVDALVAVTRDRIQRMSTGERRRLAVALMKRPGVSQRRAHELTGVSRDTLRKYADRSATE